MASTWMKRMRRQDIALLLAAFFILYNLLRALRAPNLWSATQFYWNYEFGFIRRGLLGEIVRQSGVGVLYRYDAFVTFAWGVLVLELALLLILLRRACWNITAGKYLLTLWFLSLPFAFHLHLVGYADHLVVLITLLLMCLPAGSPYRGPLLLTGVVVGMLIHELFLIFIAPVLIFRMAILWTRKKHGWPEAIRRFRWEGCALLVAGAMAVWLTFGAAATMSGPDYHSLSTSIERKTGFPARMDNFDMLARGSTSMLNEMEIRLSAPEKQKDILKQAAWIVPASLFYCWLAFVMLRQAFPLRKAAVLGMLYLLLALSPILLMRIAWDYSRWLSHSGTVAFLLMLVLLLTLDKPVRLAQRHLAVLWAALVVLSLGGELKLMDGQQLLAPPFSEHKIYIKRALKEGTAYPPIPRR